LDSQFFSRAWALVSSKGTLIYIRHSPHVCFHGGLFKNNKFKNKKKLFFAFLCLSLGLKKPGDFIVSEGHGYPLVNTKLDMSLGGQLGRRGKIDEKCPSTQLPLMNLKYGKGCAFSPNSNKAYSNFVCFFVLKRTFSSSFLSLLILKPTCGSWSS